MNSVRVELQPSPDATRVVLSGDLNEHAEFAPVVGCDARALVFDLEGVRRINSCGVREWIRMMDALRAQGRAITLERCSVAVVNQMNMIVNFRGDARVASVQLPYLCPRCDEEFVVACELGGASVPEVRDAVPCPRCGEAAEFDDLVEAYLAFAR